MRAMTTRRDFIKAGFAVGTAFSMSTLSGLFAGESELASDNTNPDLVAVRGGTRTDMLLRALACYGGIGAFVKKGQSVLIKPNIGWDKAPELGANTHPELIGKLVELCLAAGAKEVVVFDNPCSPWQKAYKTSGIEEAARKAGARMINGKDQTLYREHVVKGGRQLTSVLVQESYLDSDVVINVPVLKHHGGATMTACMKNLMGVVWNRGHFHRNDLHRCIAESVLIRKPDLNILDAYHPMMRNGPQGKSTGDLIPMETLLMSRDIVTIDAAAAKMLGHKEDSIGHVRIGAEMGIGRLDLPNLKIARIQMT